MNRWTETTAQFTVFIIITARKGIMNLLKDDIAMPEAGHYPQAKRRHRQRMNGRDRKKQKTRMKAAAIDRFGPPSVLKLRGLPRPEPGPDEVLIALHAAGVGVWDAEMRGGWWPEKKPKFPLVLGTDGAGTIAAVGARVRRFRVGEAVWAYAFMNPKGGFYSEYVTVKADNAAPVPDRLDLVHAGAAAVTALTALQGIDDHLRVRKGETVLIFGASGAVGTMAVQFAKRLGARVIGTASGKKAKMLVRRLGAAGVFDVREKKFVDELRRLAPNGIDAVLALAGGEALEKCLAFVRPRGRVAHPNGVEPGRRPKRYLSCDAGQARREFEKLNRAAEEARLQVPIAGIYIEAGRPGACPH